MEFAFLHGILEDLRSRFETKHAKSDFQLGRELILLGDREKFLIKARVLSECRSRKYFKTKFKLLHLFLEFEYNVGALRTLKLLVKSQILSVFEYLCAQGPADVNGILTDVLDCESAEDLLIDVLNNLKSDETISSSYRDCFKQYVDDLLNRPELIKFEFIGSLEKRLSREVFCDCILDKLLDELLSNSLNSGCEFSGILSKQRDWNDQFKDERLKTLVGVLRQLSVSHSEDISKMIAKKLQTFCNLNWFFMLLVVKQLNSGSAEDLKSLLSDF